MKQPSLKPRFIRSVRLPIVNAIALLLLVSFCFTSLGCSGYSDSESVDEPDGQKTPTVIVTNSIVEFFVKTLSEDQVTVVRLRRGADSKNWKPTGDEIRSLQSADLILLSGANYEPWASRLSLPRSRVIDTSTLYKDRLIEVTQSVSHQHGPRGEETSAELAWATWLDPELAMLQLQTIEEKLCKLVPDSTESIVERSNSLSAKLEELDQSVASLAAKAEGCVVEGDPFQHSYLMRRLNYKLIASANGQPVLGAFEIQIMVGSDPGQVQSARIQSCDCVDNWEEVLNCMGSNLQAIDRTLSDLPLE